MVHTAADAHAPHARAAQHAEEVSSYLDVEAVVAAAVRSGADAVHPGYGFLSENAAFARAVAEAGLTFVGPTPEVIDEMGRKDRAREIAVAAGVPVVPSYALDDDPAGLAYPVLVKAAAGGGGKGMRTVRSAAELPEAVEAAQREARSAFGDDAMLVEKYVEHGRHVEVQVMGDAHGTVLHLWHRDCSAQRRHQKVVEEAPAPDLPPGVEETVLSSAVALAQQVGYTGAGTVEYLLDTDTGEVYFLEMNTRLQVEHPVTEAVTGLDLVELQLRVADGEPLGIAQQDVRREGHAIEARVYAEDAWHGFLPQAGTATVVRWPQVARVDHALEPGQKVGTGFDPMLGKVVVHAEDREVARDLLVQALDDTVVLGLTTNTGFLRALVDSPQFAAGPVDTAWLDTAPLTEPDDAGARALAGLALEQELRAAPRGAWQPDGFRVGGQRGPLVEDGRVLDTTGWVVPPSAPDADGLVRTGTFALGDGFVRRTSAGSEVVVRGQRFVLDRADPFRRSTTAGDGTLTAPMPGTVLAVSVAEGDTVEEGQTLGVLEAMKMEVALKAAYAGTVTEVGAATGDQPGLPESVTIWEVGPRDGLQNESAIVPVEAKAEFVERLVAAGLPVVEATSFVHPRWVPQLADSDELVELLVRRQGRDGRRHPVLVPNERGLQRAIDLGCQHVAIFGSATETFAQKNLNRSVDEQLAMFEPTVTRALAEGMDVRAYVSMCFGDPWEGEVPVGQVVRVGRQLLDLGASQLSLGDTIGVGTAGHVTALLDAFNAAGVGDDRLAVHFHDTYGQALANAHAALRHGVRTFDASAGGLGGCPYAESATGNLATEDLVWMLHGLGVATGVDLEALVATSTWMADVLGRPSPSRVVAALAG
ncbi:hypothetical protein LUZ63_020373 [Rhynchospora breviuscula]|uniref:pyruvate carboxylase n=1 Tax=Rhynchospora breviuscula TaxID=2022672 RepID=A0A9Q0C0Z4_9POAL|nr:hypothetical protein LUZ63_020373 [Rhynchospora breviuscula]